MRLKILTITFVILYWVLMLTMHANANELSNAAKDLGKHYLKDKLEQHIDLDNKFIIGTGVAFKTVVDKEIEFKIQDNTKIKLNENSLMIKFSKTF